MRYLSGKKYILFFHIMHLGRYLFMFGCIHIKKYNHTMSKLYVAHGIVFILFGLPLLTGHSKWIFFSVAGVIVETIVLMAVYSLVIKKKYKK